MHRKGFITFMLIC